MAERIWLMLRPWKAGALVLAAVMLVATGLTLYIAGQGSFVSRLWTDAKSRNIPRELFDLALGTKPDSDVLDRARNQPEVIMSVEDYIKLRVTTQRIETGQRMIEEWKTAVTGIENKYGVPADTLVAIWGIESNFGKTMGDKNVVGSLATLSEAGYRTDYFRDELLAALEIIRDGHINQSEMVGSWAGAMGQTQFMPSSYVAYAVDYDGDGRKDIWNSVPDSLASTANFLKQSGWRPGVDWGYEVKLPDGFDFGKAWKKNSIPLRDWAKMGVARMDGKPFPLPDEPARFYLPSGGAGPSFLVTKNFDVIKRYNNSDSYALAVAHLADRIDGGNDFVRNWPADALPLSKAEREELATLIEAQGFKAGKATGRLSQTMRLAIIKFQKKEGLLADGHPSHALLQRLRSASSVASGQKT
jgi:membrane-bound lytic murein transglycosylase B